MALQHVRSLSWRGEDLGFGGGNTREVVIPSQVSAAARPTLTTQAFAGSISVTNSLGASVALSVAGKNRAIVNRNARFWLTVSGVAATASGSSGVNVSFPVPPLGMFFVPQNLIGPATIAMNSTWPIPQPLTGSPGSSVPLATNTNALTFDWVCETCEGDMSKVITQRYEYCCFDDATQTTTSSGVVATYPTVLDQYVANVSQSAASSFGVANVSGSGLTTVQTAAGATVLFVAPTSNTTLVSISTPAGVPLTPGGAAAQVKWLVGPGQMVTFPGVWNTTGALTAQAVDTNLAVQSTAFSLQGMFQA